VRFSALKAGMTIANVTNVNSPYTAVATDDLILVDESGGTASVLFEAAPLNATRHTVKWWKWGSTSPPVSVNGNGKNIEKADSTATYAATTAITQQGQAVTWEYDGTQWQVVS
jgi:hypothetical protein